MSNYPVSSPATSQDRVFSVNSFRRLSETVPTKWKVVGAIALGALVLVGLIYRIYRNWKPSGSTPTITSTGPVQKVSTTPTSTTTATALASQPNTKTSTGPVPEVRATPTNTTTATTALASTLVPKMGLMQVLEVYNESYIPKANLENLKKYSTSADFQRHAKTARIYYNSGQLSQEDALRVIFQREPTNIDMKSLYPEEKLKATFNYTHSVYIDKEAKKENGSLFKDLPNTACVYSETYLWNPPGRDSKVQVAILSLPAPALDMTDQPHHLYYVKEGKLDIGKYEEEMKFLFKVIEQAVRDNIKTAFGGKGIKRLVLNRFGQSNFLKSLSYDDKDVAHGIFKAQMNEFLKRIEELKLDNVLSEYGNIKGWHPNVMAGDIVKNVRDGDLIINPWDPHSAPGNGNDMDRSFDGVIGKSTAILLTQTSWLNETLKDRGSLVAVQ